MKYSERVLSWLRIPFVLFMAFTMTFGSAIAEGTGNIGDTSGPASQDATAPVQDTEGDGNTEEDQDGEVEDDASRPDGDGVENGLTPEIPSTSSQSLAVDGHTVTVTYNKDRPDLTDFYLPTTAVFTLQGVTDTSFVRSMNASGTWPEVFVVDDVPDGDYTVAITGLGQYFKDDAPNNPVRSIVVNGADVERGWTLKLGIRATLYPLQSTNEGNITKGFGHVIQQDSVCGEVTLDFNNPSDRLFWAEVLVDGEPWNEYYGGPHLVVPDDIEYGGFGTNAGASQTRTFTGGEVSIRYALGGPGEAYFDWTTFTSAPCIGTANITVNKNYSEVNVELPTDATWTITDRNTDEVVASGVTGGAFPITFAVADLPYGDYTFALENMGPKFKTHNASGTVSLHSRDFTVSGPAVNVTLNLQLTAMGIWHPLRSTNEANIEANLPHVLVQNSVCGEVTLQFNNTNTSNALFHTEVLVDGEPLNGFTGGPHQVVPDDIQYGGFSTNPGESQTRTFTGSEVEIRFALGGPGEAYFDWTTFTSDPCPEPTPTEPVTPVPTEPVTPTPTEPTVPGDQTLVITLDLPGDVSVEGAPYSLFAPLAAQFMTEPFLQGFVGPNNTIEIDGLITGMYRIVIEPDGMPPIAATIELDADALTEVVLQVDENGAVTVIYADDVTPTPTSTTTVTPGVTPEPTAEGVTSLPETGAGSIGASMLPIAAILSAVAVAFIAIPFGIRRAGTTQI